MPSAELPLGMRIPTRKQAETCSKQVKPVSSVAVFSRRLIAQKVLRFIKRIRLLRGGVVQVVSTISERNRNEAIPCGLHNAVSLATAGPLVDKVVRLFGNFEHGWILKTPTFQTIVNTGVVQATSVMRNADSCRKFPTAILYCAVDAFACESRLLCDFLPSRKSVLVVCGLNRSCFCFHCWFGFVVHWRHNKRRIYPRWVNGLTCFQTLPYRTDSIVSMPTPY